MFRAKDLIQSSPAIVSVPSRGAADRPGQLGVYEYLSKSFAFLGAEAFYWFDYFAKGRRWSTAVKDHPNISKADLFEEISALSGLGFLAVKGSEAFTKHRAYEEQWQWDTTSALFHFTIADNEFESEELATQTISDRARSVSQPSLSWPNGNKGLRLPAPMRAESRELLSMMARRRTVRATGHYALSQAELGDCLFAGLGITGYVKTPSGDLPLAMTPSGGARNPFEAYVILRRGSDLSPGVYHYSAAEHSLQEVRGEVPAEMTALLANQAWCSDMSAYIVLVGVFERTMWKYSDPNAYRVVLIEAGHVAQNIMVAATNIGLTACPTAAIAHGPMSETLQIDKLTHVPMYVLTLDKPAAALDTIQPNPLLNTPMAQALGVAAMRAVG